jgi:hypothetical protein
MPRERALSASAAASSAVTGRLEPDFKTIAGFSEDNDKGNNA